jgi:hypothetical protein
MEVVSEKIESRNKALVPEAFDTPFKKRHSVAAERFGSPAIPWEAASSSQSTNLASELCS